MAEQLVTHERRLYPSRSGERIEEYVHALSQPPERLLDHSERAEVVAFENELINGSYQTHDGEIEHVHETRSLEVVVDTAKYLASRHEFTVEYFLTPEGKAKAASAGLELPEDESDESMLASLREQASTLDRKILADLAKASRTWTTEQFVEEFTTSNVTPDVTRVMVFDDTAKLRNTVQAYQAYRDFCLRVRRDMHRQPHPDITLQAKNDVVDIYLKAINGNLAGLYPDMLWAWDQAKIANDIQAMRDLREAWPGVGTIADARPEVRANFIRGLDYLRNGTAYDEDGRPTVINQELEELFGGDSPDLHERKEVLGGRFTPEEHERLSKIEFDADGMQAFCKDILAELGLLSAEPDSTYTKDRPHRAFDNLWQAIIREDISAMGAEDPEGVLEIPTSFKRSLTKATAPVGVIAGAAHEIAHIYQLNNARNNQGSLRLAMRVRGRSSLVLREAGSVYVEHLVQNELFGADRPDNPHYMRAMKVIEAGGGEKAAVKAFYESYQAANPEEPAASCIKIAESRVMRLCRRYGGYNSQPLNYAQTAAFVSAADGMSEQQRAQIFAEGAFDLPDMLKLHQYGLLSNAAEQFPVQKFCDIVERKLRKILEEQHEEDSRAIVS